MRLSRPLHVLALVAGLAAPTSAAEAVDCGSQVVADWQDNGVVDANFDMGCYRKALAREPADARQYSDFAVAVRTAMTRDRRLAADAERRRREAAAAAAAPAAPRDRAGSSGGVPDDRVPRAPTELDETAEPAPAEPSVPLVEPAPTATGDDGSDLAAVGVGDEPAPPAAARAAAPAAFDPFAATEAGDASSGGVPRAVLVVGTAALLLGALGCAGLAAHRRQHGLS